jgi:hypothetical protein
MMSKLWIDLVARMPWLESKPYLVDIRRTEVLVEILSELGFRVVRASLPAATQDVEEELLIELSRKLDFSELGAGSWAAYSDRLWDLQMLEDVAPVAVVVEGLDVLLRSDVHSLLRCAHNLLSMTEAVGLSDDSADLQIEYFFTGVWQFNVESAGDSPRQ